MMNICYKLRHKKLYHIVNERYYHDNDRYVINGTLSNSIISNSDDHFFNHSN